ncbi:unnamed protein product [Calicophoron daubneyi]|uniref:Calcineurin-like phosphoesterase domain-containing protein n=1 Tax=Calicophoron daubneyi TaxID=300641 RepID=A0AAV2THM0_CALDB
MIRLGVQKRMGNCTVSRTYLLLTGVLMCVIIFLWKAGQDNDVGMFWHLADAHLRLAYLEGLDSENQFGPKNNEYLVRFVVEKCKYEMSQGHKPDFVIWGGDIGPHKNLTPEQLIQTIRWFSDRLNEVFENNSIPIFPTIGNHDVFRKNSSLSPINDLVETDLCRRLATDDGLWKKWIDRADESLAKYPDIPRASFSQGCFHSMLIERKQKILLINLNSIIWITTDLIVRPFEEDPFGQFQWLQSSLLWARKHKAKVFIVTHKPPGNIVFSPVTSYQFIREFNDRLVSLLRKFSDIVVATFTAHEHIDSFRVLLDEDNHPAGMLLSAPSIDSSRLGFFGTPDTRIRLYKYSRRSAGILDYSQFWLHLTHDNPVWEKDYEFRQLYNTRDISPLKFATLLDRFMVDNGAESPWEIYWDHQLGHNPDVIGVIGEVDGRCPHIQSNCRCRRICAMRHLIISNLEQCYRICNETKYSQLRTIRELSSMYSLSPN